MQRALLWAALLQWSAGVGLAQNVGGLEGRITDSRTFKPVAGAVVSLVFEGTTPATTNADADGNYRFVGLTEGVYLILVELPGYQPAVQQDARVVRGKTAVYDFELVQLRFSESVVITAKTRSDDPRTPVTNFSYDREQLRRSPGTAGDVFRALDSLPGVTATGEFSSFTVRGRGPRDNLILVDGIPFDKVIHFDQSIGEQEDAGGGGRFSIFAPNLIGEAEFQPGGFSTAFGGKNGSLLRLDIAEGNRVSPSISGRVEVTGWEFNYDGPSYLFNNTSFLFSARNQQFERLFQLVGEDTIGAPSLTDIIFKSTSQLNDRHTLDVIAIYTPEDFERDLENVLNSDDDETGLARTSQDSALFGVNWRYLTGERSFLKNTFFYRSSDKRSIVGDSFPDLAPDGSSSPDDIPVREDILDLNEGETEVGWRGDFNYATSRGDQLAVGARLTRVDLDYSTVLDGPWIRYVYDTNDFRPDPEQKFIVLEPEFINASFSNDAIRAATYAEYALKLGESVTLTPGLRYDYDGLSEQSLWSPRVNANIALNADTRLNFATGLFYQNPRFLEIAADPVNSRLRNERSLQFLAGLNRFIGGGIRFSVEGYYQKLDDLVVVPDRTTAVATNGGDGYTTGVDFLVSKTFQDKWYWQANYSYAVAKRNDNQGQGEYDADFNRPHLLNTFVSYEFNDRWVLSGKWRFASGRPTDDFIVHDDVFNDPNFLRFSKEIIRKNALRLRSFQTLNVRVDYRRRLGPVSLILFLDVFNVYDYENVSSLDWNEKQGVNRTGGLGLLPQFGLKFEF